MLQYWKTADTLLPLIHINKFNYDFVFLPCNDMHKHDLCRHSVSVCLSVTFVSCIKTNKDILAKPF